MLSYANNIRLSYTGIHTYGRNSRYVGHIHKERKLSCAAQVLGEHTLKQEDKPRNCADASIVLLWCEQSKGWLLVSKLIRNAHIRLLC